jgi:hypothetical protein
LIGKGGAFTNGELNKEINIDVFSITEENKFGIK